VRGKSNRATNPRFVLSRRQARISSGMSMSESNEAAVKVKPEDGTERTLAGPARLRMLCARIVLAALLSFLASQGNSAVLPTNVTLYAAAFGNGTFVSVGGNGAIFSSVSGGPWEQRVSGTTNRLEAVAFGGGLFLAAAENGALLSSPDGVTWTTQNVAAVQRTPQIAYGNGKFVVAGKGGAGQWTMLVSSNAVNWTTITLDVPGPSSAPEGLPLGALAFGAGKFIAAGSVAGGAKLFLTSTDGVTWKEQGAEGTAPASVRYGPMTFGNGKFGVIENFYQADDDDSGFYDRLLISEDGNSWGPEGYYYSIDLRAVAAGNCTWVVAADYFGAGVFYVSSREDFYSAQGILSSMSVINALAFGNGRFFAFGTDIEEVLVPPVPTLIPIQPTNHTVSLGLYSGVYFSSAGSCLEPPVLYQWQHNGTNLPGETNLTLYIAPLSTNDNGQYTMTASNALGQIENSVVAHLTAVPPSNAPPNIYYPLTRTTNSVPIGYDTSLNVGVNAWPPPTYQWSYNGANVPAGTNYYLSIVNPTPAVEGVYRLFVSNAFGTAQSPEIVLQVTPNPPEFYTYYQSYSTREESRFEFVSPYQYWFYPYWLGGTELHTFRNNLPYRLPLSLANGLALNRATLPDAGEFRFVLSNAFGMSTALVANVTVAPGDPLDRWTQRNPLPQNQSLFDTAYGNGTFVSVGERGSITRSTNGIDWTATQTTGEAPLSGVAFGSGVFVAVGGANIFTSSNGSNWVLPVVRFEFALSDVIFANGRFVAAGGDRVVTSTDGLSWSDATLPFAIPRDLRSVAFGNGTYVAVANGSTHAIWSSTDGTNWSSVVGAPADDFESVAFGNGLFVAVGDDGAIYTSPEGTNWTARNSTVGTRLLGVSYGAGKFIVSGSRGRILSSVNGISWNKETSGTPDRLESVRFVNNLFVAVGENGTTLTSPNGTSWTKRSQGSTRDLDGMTQGGGQIVIVGKGGTILTSSNGAQFVQQNSGVTNDLHGVGYGSGLYVAVGEPEIILTSSNAVQWQTNHSGGTSSLKSVRRGINNWIAVGTQGRILSSIDGVTWTPRTSTTCNDLNDVVYGDGLYVVVGDNLPPNGTMLTSPDGVTWTRRPQFIGKNLRSVNYANQTFIATANDETFIVSSNAAQWSLRSAGLYPGYGQNLRAATFAADTWVMVGNAGTVLTSSNALDWTRRSTPTVENLHGITFLNNRFVTMGNRGTVLQTGSAAPQPSLSSRKTGAGFEIGFHGTAGVFYELQATDAIGQPWTPIRSFTLLKANTNIVDSASLSNAQRFYRAVVP
jgi:hypothetical protein